MNKSPNCCITNCGAESIRYVFKKPYCNKHFEPAIKDAFFGEYQQWNGKSESAKLMMDLFSIYFEHKHDKTDWHVYLSRARIRDRTYNIKKIVDGFTFCIVRHLNAWNDFKSTENVEQIYHFKITTEDLQLLRQDPDDSVNQESQKIADAILFDDDHPAITKIESPKYGNLILINPKKLEVAFFMDIRTLTPRETKRLKEKIKFLIGLYSDLRPVNYRKMLAYKCL